MGMPMNLYKLLMQLTGGRPMKYCGSAFTDKVSGKAIKHYTDQLGRQWLAENSYSLFRVRRHNDFW